MNVASWRRPVARRRKRKFRPKGEKYELKLVRAYTGEVLSVVYRVGDT